MYAGLLVIPKLCNIIECKKSDHNVRYFLEISLEILLYRPVKSWYNFTSDAHTKGEEMWRGAIRQYWSFPVSSRGRLRR